MTVYQNHESTSGDSFLETTDLYQKLSEQSPAIKAIVDAELSKQGLIENKDLAILAMSTQSLAILLSQSCRTKLIN